MKGKKEGLKRSGTPSSKYWWTKKVKTPLRSARLTPSSTSRPSHWWNIGEWVASESRRKVLPWQIIRTGGSIRSMVLIWTGEVWVRKTTSGPKKKVSCMSRAGWSGGKLRASKL